MNEIKYKIILNDIYPQCLAYNLTEQECIEKLNELRKKHPNQDIRAFTIDGDSCYW